MTELMEQKIQELRKEIYGRRKRIEEIRTEYEAAVDEHRMAIERCCAEIRRIETKAVSPWDEYEKRVTR